MKIDVWRVVKPIFCDKFYGVWLGYVWVVNVQVKKENKQNLSSCYIKVSTVKNHKTITYLVR